MKTTIVHLALAAVLVPGAILAGESEARTYAVRTGRPERRTIAQTLVKTGSLAAPAEVSLCPKVAGRLAATATEAGATVEVGTRVRAGEVVARIDDRDYVIARDSAAAAVQAAQAESNAAAREFARIEKLRGTGVATEKEHDDALAARDRAAAALEQARCALAAAELNLAETAVRAPFDGVVSAKLLHPGAMVTAADPLYTIVATDPLRAVFDIPTSSLPLLRVGETKVKVTVDAYPGESVDLVVAEAYPAASTETRTVTVRADLPNPEGRYRPGMFATGAFALDERQGVLVVPFEAVLRIRDRHCVYKAAGGRAALADVSVGLRHDEVVEIASGLDDGDEIIVDGLHRLTDGAQIRVVE